MSSTTETALASWRNTATTRAILEFVAAATREGDDADLKLEEADHPNLGRPYTVFGD